MTTKEPEAVQKKNKTKKKRMAKRQIADESKCTFVHLPRGWNKNERKRHKKKQTAATEQDSEQT